MEEMKATGRVTVSKIPAGGAPEEIRAAWLGLTLPCFAMAGMLSGHEQRDAVTGEARERGRFCVIVPQGEALEILAKSNLKAAQWWRDRGYPLSITSNFTFGLDEVTILSGVTLKPVIQVCDDMQGDPHR